MLDALDLSKFARQLIHDRLTAIQLVTLAGWQGMKV